MRMEAHRLRIDGNGALGEHAFGQVFFVKMNGHVVTTHRRHAPNAQWVSAGLQPAKPHLWIISFAATAILGYADCRA